MLGDFVVCPCVSVGLDKRLTSTRSLQIMASLPKRCPFLVSVDKSAPESFVCDDVKLFRIAMAFVSTACHRTESGFVRLHILSDGASVRFECEDSAPSVDAEDAGKVLYSQEPQTPKDMSLYVLAFASRLWFRLVGVAAIDERR